MNRSMKKITFLLGICLFLFSPLSLANPCEEKSIEELMRACPHAPAWLRQADTENAIVSVYNGYYVAWHDGIWKNGTWIGERWENGIWLNGTWKQGTWYNGTWYNGVWNNGKWINGVWEDGIWNGDFWEGGTWNGGTWNRGHWWRGVWNGGTWVKGSVRYGENWVEAHPLDFKQ